MRFFAGMNQDRRLTGSLRAAGRLALALALALPATASAEEIRNHFDMDSLARAPGFFDLIVIGAPGKTRWLVLTDPNPPSSANRLVQTDRRLPADSIAVALRRNVSFQDGTASTFVHQGPGRAGMVLRMTDDKNFLLILVDTATGEVVLSRYTDGQPTELGRGLGVFPHPWQKLAVRLAGHDVSVTFAEKPIFDAKDPKPAAGRMGLAAPGGYEVSFDEFNLQF